MPIPLHVFWSEEPNADVVAHLAEHGVSILEAEAVLAGYFDQRQPSRAGTGRWIVEGRTPAGRYLVVVFDFYPEEGVVVPVTAFEPESLG